MMLSTFINSALVVIVAALVSTTTSAESIGLRNFIEEQPAVGTPCTSDSDCGPSVWDYCKFPLGSCGEDGQPGKCAKATPACARNFDWACTCDGKTASNRCTAGPVSLRSLEKCPKPEPEDRSASGGCSSNDDCGSGEFCKKADGDCDGVGECQVISRMMNKSFRAVCGCDGYFYANGSVANANGTNVDYSASNYKPEDCPNGSPTIIDTAIE